MFERLGKAVIRRRRLILVGSLLFVVLAGAFGGGVAEPLSNGGFDDPNAESSVADDILAEEFGAQTPNFVLLVSAGPWVDDPEVARAGLELTQELTKDEGIGNVASYWAT